jgi:hypothetical protein
VQPAAGFAVAVATALLAVQLPRALGSAASQVPEVTDPASQ